MRALLLRFPFPGVEGRGLGRAESETVLSEATGKKWEGFHQWQTMTFCIFDDPLRSGRPHDTFLASQLIQGHKYRIGISFLPQSL